MSANLIRYFKNEKKAPGIRVLGYSIFTGVSRGMLLAVINAAAALSPSSTEFYYYGFAFTIFLVLYISFNYLSLSRARILGEEALQNMRIRVSGKLMRSELRIVEGRDKGDLYTQLTSDINQLSDSAVTLINIYQSIVILVFCFIYIGFLSQPGMILAFITVSLGISVYYLLEREAISSLKQARVKEAEFFDAMHDMLGGFKEIKMNNKRHEEFRNHIKEISRVNKTMNIRANLQFTYSFLSSQIFMFIMIALLVFVIPKFQPEQNIIIFQFLAAILFIMGPLETLVTSIPVITKANVLLDNIVKLESLLDKDVTGSTLDPELIINFTDRIELRDVCYSFIDEKNNTSFDIGPVNLSVTKGESLFIVGSNGSGKTTLLKLLTGLYKPDSGDIFVDGKVLASGDYPYYRQLFTTVFTDFHLFKHLYGIDIRDENSVNKLLEILQLNKKTAYVDGDFTNQDLSTGQRKRLAYLVSVLENRQLFIFDEFAADQDPDFRMFFYDVIIPELNKQGKTIIAVTHDDKYFNTRNRIIRMDYGQVVDFKA